MAPQPFSVSPNAAQGSLSMRAYGKRAHARIIRQRHRGWWGLASSCTLLVGEVTHGGQIRAVLA
jgi:hypothetical protein